MREIQEINVAQENSNMWVGPGPQPRLISPLHFALLLSPNTGNAILNSKQDFLPLWRKKK
jgi:hypothetical protein